MALTGAELVEIVRDVIDKLGIKEHLPNLEDVAKYGGVTKHAITKAGGLKLVQYLTGLPFAPRNMPKKYNARKIGPNDKDFVSHEKVIPSQAFKKQAESGIPYGEIQKAETLNNAGKIDISQYAGMKTYAERMQHGN